MIGGRLLIVEQLEGGFLLTAHDGERDTGTLRLVAHDVAAVQVFLTRHFAPAPNPPPALSVCARAL